MQKLIPEESDPEYQNFLLNPEDYFLSSLSTESDIVKAMPAVQNVMAILSHDEEYIHQLKIFHSAASFNDPGVLKLLERFSAELDDIEKIISQRNKDTTFKNRNGAGIPP
ncbi:OLC1v1028709C1 [Oldenlandia corymbosa var. corymbosa]|uniref:OLC1v1028709C1 n=1 Tax=Oldenlandia corymbosa var. corymbosa TaxID=529605 RepID=A0AAV1CCD0_OLDCO|nr:OLC1v1028709C1 [Oldenlandia corymbosa var. corymbosa]